MAKGDVTILMLNTSTEEWNKMNSVLDRCRKFYNAALHERIINPNITYEKQLSQGMKNYYPRLKLDDIPEVMLVEVLNKLKRAVNSGDKLRDIRKFTYKYLTFKLRMLFNTRMKTFDIPGIGEIKIVDATKVIDESIAYFGVLYKEYRVWYLKIYSAREGKYDESYDSDGERY